MFNPRKIQDSVHTWFFTLNYGLIGMGWIGCSSRNIMNGHLILRYSQTPESRDLMKLLQSLLIVFLLVGVYDVSRSRGDETGRLQAGTAVVDISPVTLPALQNGGFLQAMRDRIDDPLYARCLVISDEQETIALVIVDSCMFSTALCDEIKRLAAEQCPIPTNRMMISATHTHAAPCGYVLLSWLPQG